MGDIDIVILWVDGNDPKWQEEFYKYAGVSDGDKREIRFRDLGTLKYLFRGIEKFAPWVRTVHFVTCGHYPEWLNMKCPKLHFVKHSDYIPAEYLPTFNANTIELNIHKIEGLSERFVYFNDDMFILRPVDETVFFKKGLPCDIAALNAYMPCGNYFDYLKVNNLSLINRHFNRSDVTKNICKWLNPKYGKRNLQTLLLLPYPNFTGFVDPHLPAPYLKETFQELWDIEEATLDKTCRNRFRTYADVNQWVLRYYQLLTGNFTPYNPYKYDYTVTGVTNLNLHEVSELIKKQKTDLVCLNDNGCSDIEAVKKGLREAFDTILPEKCSFEL